MVSLTDIRNAKLGDLFCATIKKELTWEEADKIPLSIEGMPKGIRASEVLKRAVEMTLEDELGEVTEEAVTNVTEQIKHSVLSELTTEQGTILFKKGDEYFDMAQMKPLINSYKVNNLKPLSNYSTNPNDIEIVDGEEGLEFNMEEEVFEKYLEEIGM